MKKSIILCSLSAILLCSCAAWRDPAYQQKDFFSGTGFVDTRVNEDTFFVTFIGDPGLSEHECKKYALRRSSELAMQGGFEYFKVIDEDILLEKTEHESASLTHADNTAEDRQLLQTHKFTKKYVTVRMKIKCYTKKPWADDAICAHDFLVYNFPYALS